MSGRGNPYDNAKAESFLGTLKGEEMYLKEYRNIEEVDNNKRLHSSLGYLPPAEFETAQAEKLTRTLVR